jgi:serine/threonine protein kinase
MDVKPDIPKAIGRYEILSLVGRGGMGVLYRARDPRLERDVALKMMLVDFRSDPNALDRFQREAKAVARLQHRNVVTIHELGDVDSTPYIVMEMLGGSDLDQMLRSSDTHKTMTLADKLDVVIQLCDGLNYAHGQGIVHRDIKPSNIRVLGDGSVKILDFGIARFVNNTLTQSGTIMGTPSYMAPEQILGQPLDGRADLFSSGVLMYELLAGKKPFQGESPTSVAYQIVNVEPTPLRAVAPQLPQALSDVVSHALRKKPEERYQRASELASDLRMIRTTLDPVLSGASVSSDATGSVRITLGPLHATSALANESTVLDVRIRETAERPMAGKPAAGGGKTAVIAAALVGVVAIGGVGLWYAQSQGLLSGGAAAPTNTAATSEAAKAPESKDASPPAGGSSPTTQTSAAQPIIVPPPPEAPPLEIAVSSSPAGAKIVLNGADTGKVTPATVAVADGRALELSFAGYQTLKVSLTDAELKAGRKEFKLVREPRPVKLDVEWTEEFQLFQGTKLLTATAATDHQGVTVQPNGEPVIARNAALFLSYALPVDFQRGQASVTIPAPGTIAIFSQNPASCDVKVDRQSLGPPPIIRRRVASGRHEVSIACADGRKDTRRVVVEEGQPAEVRFLWNDK